MVLIPVNCNKHVLMNMQNNTIDVILALKNDLGCMQNAPVTMVTSVPWERERDITEISPLWELLPFNLSWSPIGSRQSNDWPIVAKHANMTSSRQYKCDARDNYIRIGYWTP